MKASSIEGGTTSRAKRGIPFSLFAKTLLADEPVKGVSVAKRLKTLDRGQASKGELAREKGQKLGDFTYYGSKHKAKIISLSVIQERIRKCTIYYNEYSAKRVAHIHLTNTLT